MTCINRQRGGGLRMRSAVPLLCLLLLAAYGFMSLAVFTPLHVHGKGHCSLNGFDAGVAEADSPAFHLPYSGPLAWLARDAGGCDVAAAERALAGIRGPPRTLHFSI